MRKTPLPACWFWVCSRFRSLKPTPPPARPVRIGRDASAHAARSACIEVTATVTVARRSFDPPMALTATGALASEFAAESAKAEARTAGPAAPREELRFEVLFRSTERDGSIIGTPGTAGKLQDAGNTAEGLVADSCPLMSRRHLPPGILGDPHVTGDRAAVVEKTKDAHPALDDIAGVRLRRRALGLH
jgi:hypothetical protein